MRREKRDVEEEADHLGFSVSILVCFFTLDWFHWVEFLGPEHGSSMGGDKLRAQRRIGQRGEKGLITEVAVATAKVTYNLLMSRRYSNCFSVFLCTETKAHECCCCAHRAGRGLNVGC